MILHSFIIVLLLTVYSVADQIVSREGDIVTVVASGEYIMGDSDNRKEARTMALTQAKVNASEVAGTYIESNFESVIKQTNDSQVDKVTKQELRSFSAAILQSEITNDNMEMLADKTTVYKITIKAKVDLATLRERVKQIGEDKTKKDRLIGLEKENSVLTSALQKLSEQMRILENAKSVKPEEIKVLRDERDRLFTKLEKNEGATKLIFEKGSVLNEYQQKLATLTEIAKEVDDIIVNHLSEYVSVNIKKPKVVSQKGDKFGVEVEYSWDIDYEKMRKMLLNNYLIKTKKNFDSDDLRIDYEEMGFDYSHDIKIINSITDRIPKHAACIKFSLLNENYHWLTNIVRAGSGYIYNSGDGLKARKISLTQDELNMFTEVTSEIVVDGECT